MREEISRIFFSSQHWPAQLTCKPYYLSK